MDPQNNQTLSTPVPTAPTTPPPFPPMSAGAAVSPATNPVTTPVIKFSPSVPAPSAPVAPLNAQRPATMPSSIPPVPVNINKPSSGGSGVSIIGFLLLGLILGGGVAYGYFTYLVPKPEPVVVEKQVPVVQNVPILAFPTAPAKTYDFKAIKVLDSNSATTTLSDEDSVIVESVKELLKKDKDIGSFISSIAEVVVSPGLAFTRVYIPKDSAVSGFGFIIDLEGGKVLEKFSLGNSYFMDQGTFVFGSDSTGLSYYSYGASASVKVPNSSLTGNQTYVEFDGPNGASGYKVTATSTNSITFGVYDKKQGLTQPGDSTTHYKKVGERAFLIP